MPCPHTGVYLGTAVKKVVWFNVGKRLTTVTVGEAAEAVADALGYLDNKQNKQAALREFTIKMRKALHCLVREAKAFLTTLILCAAMLPTRTHARHTRAPPST